MIHSNINTGALTKIRFIIQIKCHLLWTCPLFAPCPARWSHPLVSPGFSRASCQASRATMKPDSLCLSLESPRFHSTCLQETSQWPEDNIPGCASLAALHTYPLCPWTWQCLTITRKERSQAHTFPQKLDMVWGQNVSLTASWKPSLSASHYVALLSWRETRVPHPGPKTISWPPPSLRGSFSLLLQKRQPRGRHHKTMGRFFALQVTHWGSTIPSITYLNN